jgi:hypothetical protein
MEGAEQVVNGFAGEAYNLERGVTNDVFPNERESAPECRFNATPEDHIMRLLAPLSRQQQGSQAVNNGEFFIPLAARFRTLSPCRPSSNTTAALSDKQVNLFSDLLLHRVGSGLADGIAQGKSCGDELRTAPLCVWDSACSLCMTIDLPSAVAAIPVRAPRRAE